LKVNCFAFWNFTGNVAVGNLSKMLPFVLQEIEKQPKRQYLLLHSLKEVSWMITAWFY